MACWLLRALESLSNTRIIPEFDPALPNPGDVVAVRERSKTLEVISNSVSVVRNRFSWIDWNGKDMEGKF